MIHNMDPNVVAIGGGIVLLFVVFIFRKKKPVQPEQGPPAPLSRVSREEWEELRALEELAAERSAYNKRLERARAAIAPPRAVLRAGDDEDMEGDSDEVN